MFVFRYIFNISKSKNNSKNNDKNNGKNNGKEYSCEIKESYRNRNIYVEYIDTIKKDLKCCPNCNINCCSHCCKYGIKDHDNCPCSLVNKGGYYFEGCGHSSSETEAIIYGLKGYDCSLLDSHLIDIDNIQKENFI
jgi:hypothetical protein